MRMSCFDVLCVFWRGIIRRMVGYGIEHESGVETTAVREATELDVMRWWWGENQRKQHHAPEDIRAPLVMSVVRKREKRAGQPSTTCDQAVGWVRSEERGESLISIRKATSPLSLSVPYSFVLLGCWGLGLIGHTLGGVVVSFSTPLYFPMFSRLPSGLIHSSSNAGLAELPPVNRYTTLMGRYPLFSGI